MADGSTDQCPECGAPVDPAGRAAGETVECTNCGKTFPLPASAEQRPSGATTQTRAVAHAGANTTANLAPTVSPVGLRPLDTSSFPARAVTGIAGRAVPTIPGYEILEELGRGGMGVVYKARQISLNRIVALKMILAGPHADQQLLARFRVEAEAIARINHPNIVQIYEVADYNGAPYFTLEFLEGGSLSKRLDATPQPARWCAEICEKLARGVHAAHQQGIIHRDLKPANVLLAFSQSPSGRGTTVPKASPVPLHGKAAEGGAQSPLPRPDEPKLTDFGLAKRIESADGMTVTGQVVGTPSYMSPEQAEGNSQLIGPKSDVYSLGAILYEMLTGRPPFKGPTHLATLHQVKHDEPLAPRRLQPGIPRDIETICLKCIQKEPAKRYASAEELAEDLHRFLCNETIIASPATALERGVKWARRRPAVAALVTVSALALVGFVSGSLWYNARLVVALQRAKDEAAEKERQRQKAMEQEEAAKKNLREAQRRLADSLVSQGDALVASNRLMAAIERYHMADSLLESLHETDVNLELGLLLLHQRLSTPLITLGLTAEVYSAAFFPDGRFAVSGSTDNSVKLWDLATGRNTMTMLGHTDMVLDVAVSPDGKLVLSGSKDHTLKLWDVTTGRNVRTFEGHTDAVAGVAFSPTGEFTLSGSFDKTLKLWSVASGQELKTFPGHEDIVTRVTFSPDGKLALSGGVDATARVWDVGSGRELMVLRGHTKIVFGVAFSPDGKLALSGSDDDTLRLWEIKNGREITTMIANEKGPNGITSVAFSPDGKYILSGSYYGRMKQWDVSSGLEIKEFAGHTSSISRVAFSANGHVVLSAANYDKTLKTWAAGAGKEIRSLALRAHDYRLREARFSPDARLLLLPREDHRLTLLDADTGRELHRFSGHRQPVTSVAFSPTAKFVLSGSEDNTVKLWETASGRELRTFEGHSGKVTTVAFSPDGATVVSGGWDKTVRLWERNSGRQIRSYSGHKDVVWAAAISPDGQRALSIGHNDGMNLWDVETGREVRTFAYTGNMFAVMFSPDGKLAATSPELTLWNLDTGYQPVTFPFATNGYESVAFSTDSALLLAGQYDDASLSVWDLRTGREVRKATWGRHVVATSPGLGKLLATTKWERDPPPPSLELWDLTLATKQCEFNAILPKAREAIQKNENDAEAHRTLGEWYAFRGVNDWAVEMLEKARKYGADVSPLTLARCYWLLSEDEHEPKDKRPAHRAAAATEFQKEISRVKAQPVPQEPKAKLAREQEELYLDICLQAVQRPVTERTP